MDWLELLYQFLPWVIGILIGIFTSYYLAFKGKTKEFKAFIDTIHNALEDDKVTTDELKAIVAAGKALFGV